MVQVTGAQPCGQPPASLKPNTAYSILFSVWGATMQAIGMIATFLVVILALNFYEFGRGD